MKNNKFLLFAIAPLLGFLALPGLTTKGIAAKSLSSKAHSLNASNLTEINYGSSSGGYYDTTKSVTDTGATFPNIAPYSLKEDKYAYFLNSSSFNSEVTPTVDWENSTISFSCPYFLPSLNCPLQGYLGNLIRNTYGDVIDIWSMANKIDNDGFGQPSFKTFEVRAHYLNDIDDDKLDDDITNLFEFKSSKASSPDGTRHSIDGATFGYKEGVNENLYDYTKFTVILRDISFTKEVVNSRNPQTATWYYLEQLPTSTYLVSAYFTPSYHINLSLLEELKENYPSVPVWYEAAKTPTSHGSFKNKETAINEVASLLLNDINTHRAAYAEHYNNHIFSENNTFEFTSEIAYNDYTGLGSKTFSSVRPYDLIGFKHGYNFDITIVPIYELTTEDLHFRHKIDHLVAFKKDDPRIQEVVKQEATKLVEERNVFEHKHAANSFIEGDESEDVIFKDYQFYKSIATQESAPLAYTNHYDSNYSLLKPVDTVMTTGHLIEDPQEWDAGYLPLVDPNAFYSFQFGYRNIENPTIFTKNFVLTHENTDEEWPIIAEASGDEAFVNIYNNLYVGEDKDEYVINEDYDNKITFKSADALFIRVTKDGIPEYHTAYTTYNSDGTNPATLKEKNDYVLDMNEEGEYKIDFMNRTDSIYKSITMKILGDNKFNVKASGDNSKLNLNITNLSSQNLRSLSIYRSKTFSSYTTEQTHIERLTSAVDPSTLGEKGFSKLTNDESAEQKEIVPTTLNYEFIESRASQENQFHECFYIEAELLNTTRYFYLYWNYKIPEFTISVNVTGEGIYSGKTAYKEGETSNITLTPNEGYKITAVSWDGVPYPTSQINPFTMTIEKEVTKDVTLNVTFSNIIYYSFTATYDKSQGTVIYKDKYSEFETAYIEVTPNPGYIISSIKWNNEDVPFDPYHFVKEQVLTEKVNLVVTFQALTHPVTLTINHNEGGSVSGGGTYEKGSEVEVKIQLEEGYEVESIKLGEQVLEYKSTFKFVIKDNVTITVTFKKVEKKPTEETNTGLIIGICCAVGAISIGVGTVLIIRARKTSRMKK